MHCPFRTAGFATVHNHYMNFCLLYGLSLLVGIALRHLELLCSIPLHGIPCPFPLAMEGESGTVTANFDELAVHYLLDLKWIFALALEIQEHVTNPVDQPGRAQLPHSPVM